MKVKINIKIPEINMKINTYEKRYGTNTMRTWTKSG
jgi:hypothetical protein